MTYTPLSIHHSMHLDELITKIYRFNGFGLHLNEILGVKGSKNQKNQVWLRPHFLYIIRCASMSWLRKYMMLIWFYWISMRYDGLKGLKLEKIKFNWDHFFIHHSTSLDELITDMYIVYIIQLNFNEIWELKGSKSLTIRIRKNVKFILISLRKFLYYETKKLNKKKTSILIKI